MSDVRELITEALRSNVALHVKNGKLAYTAGAGGVPAELRARIIDNKVRLIEFLKSTDAVEAVGIWPMLRVPDGAKRPASLQQKQIWYAQHLNSGAQYNLCSALKLTGALDLEKLEAALRAIVQRHGVLRSVYRLDDDGDVIQEIRDGARFTLRHLELSSLSPEKQQTALDRAVASEQARPFDLERDVMLRVACLRLSEASFVLVITSHHIAMDGWSLDVLLSEFSELYRSALAGNEPQLAELEYQYADYAYSQRKALSGGALENQRQYWREVLAGLDAGANLPTDFPRPAKFINSGGAIDRAVPIETLQRLKAIARAHNVTLFMLLESVLAVLVSRWTGREDVVIGSPLAGREHEETRPLIGLFVNMLALRSRCSAEQTFSEFLRANKQPIIAAFAAQSIPFDLVVDAIAVERNLSYSPVFQVVFNLQSTGQGAPALPGLNLVDLPQAPLIKYDVELVALESDSGLTLSWKYAGSLFKEHTACILVDALMSLLEQISEQPEIRLSALVFSDDLPSLRAGPESDPAVDAVERFIEECAGVRTARLVRQGSSVCGKLVGYLSLDESVLGTRSRESFLADLRERVDSLFAPEQRPAAYIVVDDVPLTADGRLNRRQVESAYFPPQTATEVRLTEIWKEVLGCETVGQTDNFFDLGGNSLKAMRVTTKVAEAFSIDISLRAIFEFGYLEDYARQIDGQHPVEIAKILPVADRISGPLSFAQERLWLIDRIEGGSTQYHMPFACIVDGQLDLRSLQRAIDFVLERHSILRTVYKEGEQGPEQHITNVTSVPVVYSDLRTLPEAEKSAAVRALISEHCARRFDLANDPMLRAAVAQTGDSQFHLLFVMHHIAADGWSIELLTKEFANAYSAYTEGRTPASPGISVRYLDYACWQRNCFQDDLKEQQLSYWRQRLAGAPSVHALPLDRVHRPLKVRSAKRHQQRFGKSLVEDIRRICQQHDTTLFMFLHTAFCVLLSRYSNARDVVVGTPIAGRMHDDVASIIGMFVNTLALRLTLPENADFLSLLIENKQHVLDAYAHQQVPFDLIVDDLQPQRSASYTPIFQILLVLQNNDAPPLTLPGVQLQAVEYQSPTAKFDLTLNIEDLGTELLASWEYCSDLFDASTIEHLAESFSLLLETVTRDPECRIDEVEIVRDLLEQISGQPDTRLSAPALGDDLLSLSADAEGDLALAAVERFIEECAGVRAARLVRQGSSVCGKLVGYLSLDESVLRTREVFLADLQERIDSLFAPEQRPAAYIVVDNIPLTADGRLNRRQVECAYFPPRTATEVRLAEIWKEVLGCARVGQTDNFFDLGGNSLKAMRVTTKVAKAFSIDIPIRAIFEWGYLEDYARQIDGQHQVEIARILPVADRTSGPLSFAQERLWLIDRIEGDSTQYHMPFVCIVEGQLDQASLQRAIDFVLERHPILRTVYREGEQGPEQHITSVTSAPVAYSDLRALPEAEKSAAVSALISEHCARRFDLASDPMLRVVVAQTRDSQFYLLFVMHHIAADGWSIELLTKEFAHAYSAYTQGRTPVSQDIPIRYLDYACWQRSCFQGELKEQQLSFWRQRLAGAPSVHTLPLDRVHRPLEVRSAKRHQQRFEKALTADIRRICQQHDVTLFMFLHTAFCVLLGRYSNARDVVVGSPIAGRTHDDVASLIGMFVNTLALRLTLPNNADFLSLLIENKQHILDAYAHQQVPFDLIVDDLQPQRSASYTPIFQIMLVLQNTDVPVLTLPDVKIRAADYQSPTTKFDLTLNIEDLGTELLASWEYCSDLFEAQTIERLADSFTLLLEAVTRNPECRIDEIEIVSDSEREFLLRPPIPLPADIPPGGLIPERFEAIASRIPDAVAVIHDQRQLTYGELERRATQLAHWLIANGFACGKPVAVYMKRSVDLIVALVAIMKSGSPYLPLDLHHPPQRIQYILKDCEASLLLCDGDSLSRLGALAAELEVRCMDDAKFISECARHSHSLAELVRSRPLTPKGLAYVVYTSGSTGQPKGVMIRQESFLNLLLWYIHEYSFGDRDRFLLLASIGFDQTQKNVFGPLLAGATVVLPDDYFDPAAIAAIIADQAVTTVNCAPSAIYPLTQEPAHWPALASLRLLILGGETIKLNSLRDWLRSEHCRARLANTYGPSECTDTVTACDYERNEAANHDVTLPIGWPVYNCSLYVLNERMKLQPRGVPGELYIGGLMVGNGYINQEALNRKHFLESGIEGVGRLYRTGDLTRMLPDGSLDFLGRMDDQVKIRGHRVETREIDALITAYPQVKQSFTMAREDEAGEQSLISYVVLAAAQELTDEQRHEALRQVREKLSAKLPEYMIPGRFVLLDALPLTPNGKVDRNRLASQMPAGVLWQFKREIRAPRNETETLLREIWRELLGREDIGIDDTFFELGGHSLLVTRLHSSLKQQFSINVPMRTLYAHQTLVAQAALIEGYTLAQHTANEAQGELVVEEL
jgi:amino acid adenylation domain-containing protein